LNEEKSKHAGLAQEIGFFAPPACFAQFAEARRKSAAMLNFVENC
jgi:hypothetical protein